ncbi:MAG: TldD/PmbA family protein [Williamsia sp.]|nr:TldD/PmbA family protein [Williamsia sp.]
MNRRKFIYLTGMGVGAGLIGSVPVLGSSIPEELLSPPAALKKELADVALNTAKSRGATYADVRIGRYLNQFISTRENRVQGVSNNESYGIGIRVLANGAWGFAASSKVEKDAIAKTAEKAVQIAKVNARLQSAPVILAPQKGVGEVSWKTPIQKNAFEVPLKDKIDLLLSVNGIALQNGANFVNSALSQINEQKYIATTDGSYIEQDVHRLWPTFTVTKLDRATRRVETRNALSAPVGMGFEYLTPDSKEEINGLFTLYKKRYNMQEDIKTATLQLTDKLKAKPVEPGKYDIILDPTVLFLTIHESVGHTTELDRVLGYEANFAGTSFLTLDKWRSGKFKFGSNIVNFVADKIQPGSLGAIGYDDEGVPAKSWNIIKDGILVNYQTIRDQAHMLNLKESQGCCYADHWSSVPFQRMPNVSLQPGKVPLSALDMIKNVEKGLYFLGRNSYSIDQQRYNFQFSGQLCYEIRNGKIAGMVRDASFQATTEEFWNSCTAVCDQNDYRLCGTFSDGKGQPSQSSAVSHGCSTTLFKGVNVISTASKID